MRVTYIHKKRRTRKQEKRKKIWAEKPNCAPYIPEREKRERKKMKREEEREEKAIASILKNARLK